MNVTDLLMSLKENGVLLRGELSEDARDVVVAALREMRDETAAGRVQGAARALRSLKRALSVLPPGHPVAQHLGGRRYSSGALRLPPVAQVTELIDILGEPPPDPEELRRTARERLLAAPALSSEEYAGLLTGGPEPAGLIRLPDPGRGTRYPRFQFRPGTAEPLPVVRRINELLQADLDPWGAADWWLGGNVWLRGVPAELLGTLHDEQLISAAAELVEAD
ncbi:hypothetical protein E0500_010295 [Streptomyces sp. KM273126]|uniref:hypothetical protein n=1 Tax=Streptomyces sp. KM273126 TaxID=2545247 RepID=UPI00103C5FB2|nr:hypothetical protein [Streptomyces sp. KM273126]MBA2807789.1 hypothetical protein [Streptomyces sp. KM273126]